MVAEYAADKCGTANMLPYSKILYLTSFITYMKCLKQTLIQSFIALFGLTVKFMQLIVTFYGLLVHPMYVDNHNLFLCNCKSIMSVCYSVSLQSKCMFLCHVKPVLGTTQEMLCMLLNVAISETVM